MTIRAIALAGLLTSCRVWAQPALETIPIQPNFFMIAGAGGNIAIQIGADGVLMVDTGSAQFTPAVLAEIRKLSHLPVRYIINTSADADHVGGNESLAKKNAAPPVILSTENLLNRMSAANYSVDALPTQTFFQKQTAMYYNKEGIQIVARPGAHSDANALVFFRRSDVIVAGDIFDTRHFPVLDAAMGGGIQQEIDALNFLVELAIPTIPLMRLDGGTVVIPGHGRVADQADVVEYRDMVTIVRDRVRADKKKGMTLDQVKAANPTAGYRARYGADSGPWTTDMFVEAIFKTDQAPESAKRESAK